MWVHRHFTTCHWRFGTGVQGHRADECCLSQAWGLPWPHGSLCRDHITSSSGKAKIYNLSGNVSTSLHSQQLFKSRQSVWDSLIYGITCGFWLVSNYLLNATIWNTVLRFNSFNYYSSNAIEFFFQSLNNQWPKMMLNSYGQLEKLKCPTYLIVTEARLSSWVNIASVYNNNCLLLSRK